MRRRIAVAPDPRLTSPIARARSGRRQNRPRRRRTHSAQSGRAPHAPQGSYSRALPGAPKAQEHAKYLSAECASISEAIRTGPARGVRHDTLRGLQDEYRLKCSVEDEDARRRLGEENAERRRSQVAQRESVKTQRQQEEVRSTQCLGMHDVISARRKKESELDAKELESLRSLEKSYNERCLAK